MHNQFGSGNIVVYRGSPFQRGHGVGSFLKGLFRGAVPLLKRGAQIIGKEFLQSGANFVGDLEQNIPARDAFKDRFKEAKTNIKRKALESLLRGDGYKSKKRRKMVQSRRSTRKKRSSSSKKKKTPRRTRRRRGKRVGKKPGKIGKRKSQKRKKVSRERKKVVDIFG